MRFASFLKYFLCACAGNLGATSLQSDFQTVNSFFAEQENRFLQITNDLVKSANVLVRAHGRCKLGSHQIEVVCVLLGAVAKIVRSSAEIGV